MRIPLFWFDRVGKKDKDSLGTELAEFISTITDPLIITIVTLLVILKSISMTFKEATFWFLLVMGISIVPTALYIFRGMKKGVIHDWFISERKERYKVLLVGMLSLLVLNLILLGLSAPSLLLVFGQTAFLLGLFLSLTTLFWKVSFHSSFFTFFCASLVGLFGMKLAWLFIFLPLVGWARTKLKKHTWGQVIVGALMSLLITWLVFKMYNYVGI